MELNDLQDTEYYLYNNVTSVVCEFDDTMWRIGLLPYEDYNTSSWFYLLRDYWIDNEQYSNY